MKNTLVVTLEIDAADGQAVTDTSTIVAALIRDGLVARDVAVGDVNMTVVEGDDPAASIQRAVKYLAAQRGAT